MEKFMSSTNQQPNISTTMKEFSCPMCQSKDAYLFEEDGSKYLSCPTCGNKQVWLETETMGGEQMGLKTPDPELVAKYPDLFLKKEVNPQSLSCG